MNRLSQRRRRWTRAASALVVATVASAFLPVPYVVISPGPVFDVLAETDSGPVVQIEGADTFPTTGRLDMVTVSQYGGTADLAIGAALFAWLSPNSAVEPRDVRYPPGTEPDAEEQIAAAVFEASTSSALAAAANYLGRPVTSAALVSAVEPGSPAEGVLRSGDVITAVDGAPTDSAADVSSAVAARPSGSEITVEYTRDGSAEQAVITAGSRDDGSDSAYLGLLLVDNYTSDFTADVTLEGIGGPSAGMVFSLAMVDRMTPGDMLGGSQVAGTGTIDAQGNVGPIGGADKKIISVQRAGAGLFLVPRANCPDVAGAAPEGLTVVAIDTLSTAIDSIESWRAGDRELPTCS